MRRPGAIHRFLPRPPTTGPPPILFFFPALDRIRILSKLRRIGGCAAASDPRSLRGARPPPRRFSPMLRATEQESFGEEGSVEGLAEVSSSGRRRVLCTRLHC